MPDIVNTCARESGRRAFEMAGITTEDADVLALYDAFTINVILKLEDLGFVKNGEGGPFVASGAIAPGGPLPENPNGWGLADHRPGMYDMLLTLESVRALHGQSGRRRVAHATTPSCHANRH